jgi:hypothetical protein
MRSLACSRVIAGPVVLQRTIDVIDQRACREVPCDRERVWRRAHFATAGSLWNIPTATKAASYSCGWVKEENMCSQHEAIRLAIYDLGCQSRSLSDLPINSWIPYAVFLQSGRYEVA